MEIEQIQKIMFLKKLNKSYFSYFLIIFILIGSLVTVSSSFFVRAINYNLDGLQTESAILSKAELLKIQNGITRLDWPDANGLIGRNKSLNFYSSPDFQREVWKNFNYALYKQDSVRLDQAFIALELPYNNQLENGDFAFSPFPGIDPAIQRITGFDGHSAPGGNVFFLAGVASSLSVLTQSDWFNNSTSTSSFRNRLDILRPKIAKSLDFILQPAGVTVLTKDIKATNRIWVRSVAFYGLGKFLQNTAGMDLGMTYALQADSQFDPITKIFSENGGFDSSYQGVNMAYASRFTFLLGADQAVFRNKIIESVILGGQKEIQYINSNGSLATYDNTRVRPDGESFFGQEKGVDYTLVVRGLAYASQFENNQSTWSSTSLVDFYANNLKASNIFDLTLNCLPQLANSFTTCTFSLPSSKTLPIGFKISIGEEIATGECVLTTISLVTCTNVATPGTDGTFPIFANLPPNEFDLNPPKVDTAETVNILANSILSNDSNFGRVDWVFSPDQGVQAPLTKSTIQTNIGLVNFKSILDLNPSSNTRYSCVIEYRPLTDRRLLLPAWMPLGSAQDYSSVNGCNCNIPKNLRGNNLNLSLRATITDNSISNQNTFVFYNEYIYRFEGSGTAFGQ